jgi:hypothetical protein
MGIQSEGIAGAGLQSTHYTNRLTGRAPYSFSGPQNLVTSVQMTHHTDDDLFQFL